MTLLKDGKERGDVFVEKKKVGDEDTKLEVAYLITEKQFGVVCNLISLPSSFGMVKEEMKEGRKVYVRSIFSPYTCESKMKGKDRYVLSGELYLTLPDRSKKHFEDPGVCWFLSLQQEDNTYDAFFMKNRYGYCNELYGNVQYIRSLDEKKLEKEKLRCPYGKRRFCIVSDTVRGSANKGKEDRSTCTEEDCSKSVISRGKYSFESSKS